MFTLVARGPHGYKVVWYNAFRYLDIYILFYLQVPTAYDKLTDTSPTNAN